jgi:hypothetical protein
MSLLLRISTFTAIEASRELEEMPQLGNLPETGWG